MVTIFLDIDGVLSTVKQYNLTRQSKSWINLYDCCPFDEKCVEVFNEILKTVPCGIILSSDWRFFYSLEELNEIFKINGVIQSPIDITTKTTIFSKANELEISRAKQIQSYIIEHEILNYIVIDDLDMKKYFGENFFHCNSQFEGIKKSGLKEKIINHIKSYE